MKLEGLVAFVTGGASGLGAETVDQLVAAGCRVAFADLNEENGEAMVAKHGSDKTLFIQLDVTDEPAVKAAIDKTVETFGGLHVAVNCAGIASVGQTITSKTIMDFRTLKLVTEINVYGTIYVCAHAAKAMSKNTPVNDRGERGVIINVASVAAFEGQRGQVAYSASKGAIAGITTPMARDLGKYGIRVCTIAPGTIMSPMLAMQSDKMKELFLKDTPLGRFGQADEFAHMVRACVENSYLNGQTLRMDGGTVLSYN
jgi:NAD(P)-dependent dehydrogenase (short-subunit alcohol dehydrogenase family)